MRFKKKKMILRKNSGKIISGRLIQKIEAFLHSSGVENEFHSKPVVLATRN